MKYLKHISSSYILAFSFLTVACGSGPKKTAPASSDASSSPAANQSPPSQPTVQEAKPLEDITPHLKVKLLNEELRKYCYFIDVSMIVDAKEQPDKRQYTKPAYMTPQRAALVAAHIKLYQLLCKDNKSFTGFAMNTNASEKTILDILTVRHLWALLISQDHTPHISKIGLTFKQSYSAWERAFGSPEVRIWKDSYSKHSSMSEADYQKRVDYLSDWAKKQVDERFKSFL